MSASPFAVPGGQASLIDGSRGQSEGYREVTAATRERGLAFASEGSQEGLSFDAGRHGPEQLNPNCRRDKVSMDNAVGLKSNLLMDALSAQATCVRLPPGCIWLQALCPKPLRALHQQM